MEEEKSINLSAVSLLALHIYSKEYGLGDEFDRVWNFFEDFETSTKLMTILFSIYDMMSNNQEEFINTILDLKLSLMEKQDEMNSKFVEEMLKKANNS